MVDKLFKTRLFSIIIYGLVLLTIVKIVAATFTSPLIGYANNYDFVRQSSCIGIWQSYQDKPKTSGNPEAPVNSLIYDGLKDNGSCLSSIDNIFPWIAKQFHEIGDRVDFREISFWKVSLLLSGFLFLLYTLTEKTNKLAVSLVFFLVFGDIANLLYVNTLYLEFSVIAGCFFALFLTILLILSKSKNITLFIFAIISVIWLGFSKQQYMPLAVILGLICSVTLIMTWREKKFAIAFFLISIAIPFVYAQMNTDDGNMWGINFANKTDTFLGAVLPEATNKESALSILGLPRECSRGIGKNWYSPEVQQNHPCPEVQKLSRAKLIKLFISDPSIFIETIHKATIGILPFYPSYLGHLENAMDSNSERYLLLKKSSLSYALAKMTKDVFYAFVVSSIFLGLPLLILGAALKTIDSCNRLFLMMIGLGSFVILYSISSSVFGDGYHELQKHAVGVLIGIAFQVSGAALALISFGLSDSRICCQKAIASVKG